MNSLAATFTLVNVITMLALPRQWASLPLLIGTCYMTYGQGTEFGAYSFTVIRIIIAAGILRVLFRGERITGFNMLDLLMVAWGAWAIINSSFHMNPTSALVFRLGLVYNTCGIYFLLRVFCQSLDDIWRLLRITSILLLPIALEMLYEQILHHNLFSFLGGVPSIPAVREGNIRAQGPFRHAILAGTVGAVCLPLMVALWNQYRKIAFSGIFSCLAIVLCSRSSGPLVSVLSGIGGLFLWHYRDQIRIVRWAAVIGYITLDIVMKAPPYYLMGRIPLVSGSTGWHRAELINTAIRHFNEWWLWGTDYTRHWMPTGVSWSPDHTDITNHYIKMGVIGGFPLMVFFIAILATAFFYIGKLIEATDDISSGATFMFWTFGASLFANAATMISVSYFDQSFVFLYLTLALIGSSWSLTKTLGTKPSV